MKMNKYGRELDLLLLLTDNSNHTIQDMADQLGVTRRTLYYYMDYFRRSNFKLIQNGNYYQLDRTSPFFKRLHENISLTPEEALYLRRLIGNEDNNDSTARSARIKLDRFFHLEELVSPERQQQIDRNIQTLKAAMAEKKMVVLRNYSSPHSQTVADRYVEPFMLMNRGLDVRCHEIKTHTNKTYRLARMESVEILDIEWISEALHKEAYTDLFMFSGEERHPVSLRMGLLAHNLMLEECPDSYECFTQEDDTHWLFQTDFVSFLGIGRFVLGLYEDIDVLGNDEFKAYIEAKRNVKKNGV